MTTPVVEKLTIPLPGYPMVTRVISFAITPNKDGKEIPIMWAVSEANPLGSDMKVIRMFVVDQGDVEIYSMSSDGKNCIRDRIPRHLIRVIHEEMPPEVFVGELEAAEAGEPDEPEEDEPESDDTEPLPAIAANGQTASS
jgi:hypothetical protein